MHPTRSRCSAISLDIPEKNGSRKMHADSANGTAIMWRVPPTDTSSLETREGRVKRRNEEEANWY
jgi:hypothetical protein